MSELDAFSDSDWLDISSGRGDSDDNDSLSDSDHDEIHSVPRSRRSSISNESSLGGDVDAWEGFVSDSGDDARDAFTGMYSAPTQSALPTEAAAAALVPQLTIYSDPAVAEEDQRVRAGLDQSFVGTLTASRSSAYTPSTHTSIRDLRLSFPDPLTSPQDELNRSYETVSPIESVSGMSAEHDAKDVNSAATYLPQPELSASSTVSEVLEDLPKSELDVYLYGSSSDIKWRFVQLLLQKATTASGCDIESLENTECNQVIYRVKKVDASPSFYDQVNVYDRTFPGDGIEIDVLHDSANPSLAIVYLPTATLPVLNLHSMFFPVLLPSQTDNTIMLQAAEDDWDLLAVPPQRTLRIGANKSVIFDHEKLSDIKPSDLFVALRRIGSAADSSAKPLTEQIKSVNAVTVFALMSIIMGFAFNTGFRSTTPVPTPTVQPLTNHSVWKVVAPQPNRSHGIKYDQTEGNYVVSSVVQEVALTVFDSPPSSVSLVASTSKAVSEVSASSSKCGDCQQSTAADKPRVPTDIVTRSPRDTSLAEVHKSKTSMAVVSGKSKEISISASSSIIVGSSSSFAPVSTAVAPLQCVSELIDATTRAITDAVANRGITELVETADELLHSIKGQTDEVIRRSKGKARAFGERINEGVVGRNERAKRRAKEITKKGAKFYIGAKEGLFEGTVRAKKRAKELRRIVVDGGSEAWKAYGAAQEEWEGVLRGEVVKRRQDNKRGKHPRGHKHDKENAATFRQRGGNQWRIRA